ncbi:MAG: hypothetical protein WD512_07100, partial [Candidatus Paceibacterota bacterium]
MEKLIESLNVLNKLKEFFETNKISSLIYLVFLSVCVVLILHLELAWAYYFLAITAPALLTKVSMKGIDFISPSIIGKLKRMTITRKMKRLRDNEEIKRYFTGIREIDLKMMSAPCGFTQRELQLFLG